MEQELERRVQERTAELQEVNSELQQFIYVSSHDLQEPLRKIQVFSGMLSGRLDGGDEQTRMFADRIGSSASRVSLLIRNMLEYSRLSHLNDPFVPTDLNAVIRQLEGDFELLLKERAARLETGPLPVLQAIPFQINQLFYHLISNALKFAREGQPPLIRIGAGLLDAAAAGAYPGLLPGMAYHKITVTDNGTGFDQRYAEKIFGMFQRLHDARLYGGTGIGLSICRKVAANHNGTITAVSAEGAGSVFTVLLPVEQPALPA
jgi:signal transduction histidine kinase